MTDTSSQLPNPFESPTACDPAAAPGQTSMRKSFPLGAYSIVLGVVSGIFSIAPFVVVPWILRGSTPSEWANFVWVPPVCFTFALASALAGFILACIGLSMQRSGRLLSMFGAILCFLVPVALVAFLLNFITRIH